MPQHDQHRHHSPDQDLDLDHEDAQLSERVRKALEEAGEPEDHQAQERNAGIAIAVLALLIVALFVAIISGATDAYQP